MTDASSHRFSIECEGCKRGVIITLGQGIVLGYQCSCGHYTKVRDAEKSNPPPPGEAVVPGRLGHTVWCHHRIDVERLQGLPPRSCICGASSKSGAVRPAMRGDQHGFEITRNGYIEWFADKTEAVRAASSEEVR